MSKIAENIYKQQVLDLLEEIKFTIRQAEEEGDEDAMERINALLNKKLEENYEPKHSIGRSWDFSLEKAMDVFAEDDQIILRGFRDSDMLDYIKTKCEQSVIFSRLYETEDAVISDWKDANGEDTFGCAVIRKSDNKYLGYIMLKSTKRNLWEIAIEFLKEFCHEGYGRRTVNLFLKEISAITDKKQFQALVEPENEPSQYFFSSIGAELVDIYDYFFHGDEEAMERIEVKNIADITPRMIELADFLDVEPQKLLTNVLDYRIYVSDGEIVKKANFR